jgi:hypothetical protein
MMDQVGLFILKTDLVAAGTLVRTGKGPDDFCAVETLSIGDEIYDPIEQRTAEINEMSCVTLDSETIRARGFSPKKLTGDLSDNPLIYGIKVPNLVARLGDSLPIRGEHELLVGTVFFAFGFERRVTVETPSCYCEFVRPSNYAFETPARRSPAMMRHDIIPSLRQ